MKKLSYTVLKNDLSNSFNNWKVNLYSYEDFYHFIKWSVVADIVKLICIIMPPFRN